MQRVLRFIRVSCVSALILVSGCASMRELVSPPVSTRADEVAQFKPVEPERWTLANGLTVIYLRDDELPVVRGKLFIRAGSLWADGYPIGTTSAMGDNMRSGGAGDLSADALDKELEKLAARVSSSFSTEFGGVSFSCLSSDLNRVFSLFADVVLRPRFESDRLSLWKGQALESIRRRVEDPGTVATISFTQLVYGDSAYGKISRSSDISSISRSAIVDLHRRFVRPDGAILVVTGKVSRDEVAQLAERYFGAWQARGERMPPPPPVNVDPKPGIYFIALPFAQASVKLGHLGIPRFTPDYPDIDVFNEVFGSGGFGSRLMKRVRTELGLTYGIQGGIAPGLVKGTNYVFLQTKANSVGPAIDESIRVLEQLQQQDPSAGELAEKKAAIANSFVFNFGSMDDIAGRMASQELLQYPADYDKTYLSKIQGVTPDGVRVAASKRWDPSKFVIVVVGNEAAYAALEQGRAQQDSPLHKFDLGKHSFDEALLIQ